MDDVPLSPEFVLVCPELRKLALERLPPPGHLAAAARPAEVSRTATGAGGPRAALLVLAATAYAAIGITRRVATGVGLGVAVVGGYSLVFG
jgi:hypothetical protein